MSLLPYFFDDFGLRCPINARQRIGLIPEDFLQHFNRPWQQLAAIDKDIGSSIKVEKDKMQINLDVQHFSPEEISVKTADGYVVVEGRHEEREDEHGFITRQFKRRYLLPEGVAPENVESRLSSDGVLTVTAPLRAPESVKGERSVPIAQTGPVRKALKEHQEITPAPKNAK